MSVITPPHLSTPLHRSRAVLLSAFLVTAALAGYAAVMGESLSYTDGFAPPWVAVIACVLGLAGSLLPSRPAVAAALSWTAVALLSWAAAGLVFDAFRAAAVLGVPGLPPVVDWIGFAGRAAALVSGVLLAAAALRTVDRSSRPRPFWAAVAWLFAAPYPLLKVYWWAGGDLASDAIGHAGTFPYAEVGAFTLAALWASALVSPLGRAVPRRLLIAGGWFAAVALLNLGALAAFGTLADVLGIVDGPITFSDGRWVVTPVYASWLALGLVLGRLSLARPKYERR